MDPDRLVAFVGVALVVVLVPGPDMALVARNVVRHGRTAGYATSLGICTGILGWAAAAALGVSTILATSATAFTVLKVGGAIYLVYLGIRALRLPAMPGPAAGQRTLLPVAHRLAWSQGLVSAALNPKLGVFFVTLLPQFVDPAAAVTDALLLACVFDAIGLAWLVAYSTAWGALHEALARPWPRRLLNYLTGTVLIGLGVRLAVEKS